MMVKKDMTLNDNNDDCFCVLFLGWMNDNNVNCFVISMLGICSYNFGLDIV